MTAATIAEGWQAYRRAGGIHWPDSAKRVIGRASVNLWWALEMHGRLTEDDCTSGDLLDKYAEKAREARERLIEVVRQHCGEGDAAFTGGGQYAFSRGAA